MILLKTCHALDEISDTVVVYLHTIAEKLRKNFSESLLCAVMPIYSLKTLFPVKMKQLFFLDCKTCCYSLLKILQQFHELQKKLR